MPAEQGWQQEESRRSTRRAHRNIHMQEFGSDVGLSSPSRREPTTPCLVRTGSADATVQTTSRLATTPKTGLVFAWFHYRPEVPAAILCHLRRPERDTDARSSTQRCTAGDDSGRHPENDLRKERHLDQAAGKPERTRREAGFCKTLSRSRSLLDELKILLASAGVMRSSLCCPSGGAVQRVFFTGLGPVVRPAFRGGAADRLRRDHSRDSDPVAILRHLLPVPHAGITLSSFTAAVSGLSLNGLAYEAERTSRTARRSKGAVGVRCWPWA